METELLARPRVALLAHFDANPAVGLEVTRNVATVPDQVFQARWLREMQPMGGCAAPTEISKTA